MKDPRDVILAPVVSEKSYTALDKGVYTFVIASQATKTEVKDAVQRIFDVRVLKVNVLWRRGKEKRTGRTYGTRSAQKRAVVTLAEGDTIEIFQAK